jgi:Mn2+/Fe2+ NRAMP family transporter
LTPVQAPAPASLETEPLSRRPAGWRSIGPGLVFALSVIGTGDLVSNAAVGATYGYALIWALALSLIFRYVWANTAAKYALVTGESLLRGYGRIGQWIVWVVLGALIISRHALNLSKPLLMGGAAHLLFPLPTPWSAVIWGLLFTLAAFAFMFWGGYPAIERWCKYLVAALGASLLLAALLANPQPEAILRGALIPSFPANAGAYSVLLMLTALIGTEAGSMSNITYSYFIREKGWRGALCLPRQRVDLAISVACMFLMGALVQIAAAGVAHPLGIKLETTGDLVRTFSATEGRAGRIIFSLGLWAAAFNAFVGTTTGYALVATDICRSYIPRLRRAPLEAGGAPHDVRRDPVYRWFVAFWALSPLYVLATGAGPVWLALVASSLGVVVIPVLALALLKLTNDKQRMGAHQNGWFTKGAMLLMTLLSIYLMCRHGLNWWTQLTAKF